MSMQSPTGWLPTNANAGGINQYYSPAQQQQNYSGGGQSGGMPTSFGSGRAAQWVPQGFGAIPEQLSALFRVAAHDAYSGVDQHGHSYVDGDIGIKALFFPDDPAIKPLLERPYLEDALWQYTGMDWQDDGQFNGSPARRIFADAMRYGYGMNIAPYIQNAPLHNADLSWEALSRPNVDNGNAEGFRIQAEWMGLSTNELAAMVTGGHDWIPSPLDDGWGNGSTLVNAMQNPLHPDYENTQTVPGMKSYFQNLINRDVQRSGQLDGWNLAHDMADAIVKFFNR